MRILYCIEIKECKYVSIIKEIWIYSEDPKLRDASICFIDSTGTTYTSEKMTYNKALNCLDIIVKEGYLNLENIIFHPEDEEEDDEF